MNKLSSVARAIANSLPELREESEHYDDAGQPLFKAVGMYKSMEVDSQCRIEFDWCGYDAMVDFQCLNGIAVRAWIGINRTGFYFHCVYTCARIREMLDIGGRIDNEFLDLLSVATDADLDALSLAMEPRIAHGIDEVMEAAC